MLSKFFSLGRYSRPAQRKSRPAPDRRKLTRRLPQLEPLETRLAPVVAAFTPADAVALGDGFNGVVRLFLPNGSCSGSLLSTGRHILTAAHCVDFDVDSDGDGRNDRGNGAVDAGTATIQFDLPAGQRLISNIPMTNATLHPSYNGLWSDGNDIAIVQLGQTDANINKVAVAPATAERYFPFRQRDEVGRWFIVAGYGRTGQGDTSMFIPALNRNGCDWTASGQKLKGTNFFDSTRGPNDSVLNFDFDSNMGQWAPFLREVDTAAGDSGGPSFLWGAGGTLDIAAVTSGGTVGSCTGSTSRSTRVSSFAGWIDGTVSGRYDLLLDMMHQPGRNNGTADVITAQLVNGNLELRIDGQLVHSDILFNARSLTIRGSTDRDVITVPAFLGIEITVDGRGGSTDELTVTDAARAAPGTYRVEFDRVLPTSPVPIIHSSIENLVLITSSSHDSITVRHTSAALTVRAGAGNDSFFVGDTTNRLRHAVPITLDGEGGTNSLSVNDQGTLTAETYTVTDTQIRRTAGVGVTTYAGINTLTVNVGIGTGVVGQTVDIQTTGANLTRIFGSPRNDIINVQRLGWQRSTEVFAGAGDDTMSLGSAGSLDWIHSPLLLDGQTGTDTLNINDQADGIANTYTMTTRVSDTRVQRRGRFVNDNPIDFQYQAVETCVLNASPFADEITLEGAFLGATTMTVNAGGGDDTVRVRETPAGATTNIHGGAGNDTVTLGFGFNNLDFLRGTVNVHGDAGSDSMTLADMASLQSHTYNVNLRPSEISRSGGTFVNVVYSLLEAVALSAGAAGDSITVWTTIGGGTTTINGGGGGDVISVTGVAVSTLRVNGDDGNDTINLPSSPVGSVVVLDGGTGSDSLGVGSSITGLGLGGTTTVQGGSIGAGIDTLHVRDWSVSSPVGHSYTLTGARVDRSGWIGLGHGGVEQLVLTTGDAADTITGQSLAIGLTMSIDANGGSDLLIGPTVPTFVTSWRISGANAGSCSVFVHTVNFAEVESLRGGNETDSFRFDNGASVAGSVDGGAGINLLDYTAYTTDVVVNLPLASATGIGGSISGMQNVTGGAGHDILVGDHQSNVLDGGAGSDLIIGGGLNWATGQYSNLADVLRGGGGEDILIAGFTIWDTIPELLTVLRDIWAFAAPFEDRTGWLYPLLDPTWAVYSNPVANTLDGGADDDWFFGVRGRDILTQPLSPQEDLSWVELLL